MHKLKEQFFQTTSSVRRTKPVLLLLSVVVYGIIESTNYSSSYRLKEPPNYPEYKIIQLDLPKNLVNASKLEVTESGDILGCAEQPNGDAIRFVWRGGKIVSTRVLPYFTSDDKDIHNRRGDFIELSDSALDQFREADPHPILRVRAGLLTHVYDIFPEEDDRFFNAYAHGMNNKDQVVGSMCDWSSCHAFVWKGAVTADVNRIAKTNGVELTSADGINDDGWIVCKGQRGKVSGIFLLIPEKHI